MGPEVEVKRLLAFDRERLRDALRLASPRLASVIDVIVKDALP